MAKHINYSKNIFINCPFDDKYYELLKTLVFSICYYGFIPRISLENSDSGQQRLEKIIKLMEESRYSIHDLSRLQAKSRNEFYRLNMPFELGIDYGLRRFNSKYSDKRSLILETKKYDYKKAISDINGFDIKNHEDNPVKLISCIRSWITETIGNVNLNSSNKAYSDYTDFATELFKNKLLKYSKSNSITLSEKYATTEIDEMPIPEYIREIQSRLVPT